MKQRLKAVHSTTVVITILVSFYIVSAVSAEDWHALQDMSESQLDNKIFEFQQRLNKDPLDYEMLKAIGIAYHTKAKKDPKTYATKAVDFLTRAHERERKDYETMCYLGSATTMMAQTTWNPIKKMYYVNIGTGHMDKAVRKNPDNISVRMTRAFNSKNLPSFLGRRDIALEDFDYLAGLIDKNPGSLQAIKKKVYTNLAELFRKRGDKAQAEKYGKMANSL